MNYKLVFSLCVLGFYITSCKKEELVEQDALNPVESDTIISTADTSNHPTTSTTLKERMLTLVNNKRSLGCQCGNTYYAPAPAVSWNNQLEDAAARHSLDMQTHGFLSHTGSDGSTMSIRVTEAGYSWSTLGENIAQGQNSEEAAINAWMNSSGHCANIMNPVMQHMGVARSGNYWTQVFGKPM